MDIQKIVRWKSELEHHLEHELLPFWLDRCWDSENGGYLTQYDTNGNLTDCNEKSMLAHMRTLYALSLATAYGHDKDGRCAKFAKKGFDFAIDMLWDKVYGGFYWLFDRQNHIINDQKIVYGQEFAIYALATYAKQFHDSVALSYAEKCFDLLQKYATETSRGGYWEMFSRDWRLCGPGPEGGDRKTLDVHMHLMEAYTALYEVSGEDIHRRKLEEVIDILMNTMLDKQYRTGIPQFDKNWNVAPQIKFNVVWGMDRFDKAGQKPHSDNTSYGHNVELFWLMSTALKVLGKSSTAYDSTFHAILDHAIEHGIDWECGGVYVEGAADGSAVYDKVKEFWQQAELMNGMLEAYLLYHDDKYLDAYCNVHEFVMKKVIKHEVGEWWPLLTKEGKPIWTYMSNSWKVNYHTIRGSVLSIDRLSRILTIKQ
ncbi:MAG: AGE family epimerase/isomerase [Sphaerochaetaceae bacterium]